MTFLSAVPLNWGKRDIAAETGDFENASATRSNGPTTVNNGPDDTATFTSVTVLKPRCLATHASTSNITSPGCQRWALGDASAVYQQLGTAGIASVEFPELMAALFNVDKKQFADNGKVFLDRYGARPDSTAMNNISGHRQEFFFACFRFMQNWSGQWSASVSLTYMPEVYPGMLLVFPRYGVQAYVMEAEHSGSLASGGGFNTNVTLTAWSTIGDRPSIKGLPKGAPL